MYIQVVCDSFLFIEIRKSIKELRKITLVQMYNGAVASIL